ncbi:T9SS type A sorting domain-containing protein [Flavobacterium sp. CBA20B-1]|uniref:T9SS type A sorting domain-containing protein n=1 Tax=unclassified Flavobacterium TaxID=196869 RepID=UPI002224C017|nr:MULTISPECIES: T9SS type A sorting domain-containing protein [unclassified Flavobacterium]WCM42045.1 T9SS type A sorting domain-containing protein [Flavobacterium sp. CBA20B-1]
MRKTITLLFLCVSLCGFSQETINAMFYNVFKFPNSLPQNRQLILRDILDEYQPDLFMICELANENAANLILNTSLKNQVDPFARAVFVPDLTDTADPLQTMVFYNTRKLTLVGQQTLLTVYRDINHYSFQVNVDPQNPIYLEVFVAHLKSSTGPANRQMRYDMVEKVTQELQNLTQPNTYVLFAGDFNFYNANEIGYQKILDPTNAIKLIDPINAPGSWQDNASFSYLHTQSTRLSSSGFGGGANAGASGGLDDRFDFIMMSENFNTSTRFSYVNGTYKAYGNNENCLNKSVNDPSCSGTYSLTLRNNLYNMSDHLPVVMQFQINEPLATTSFKKDKTLMWFESTNVTDADVLIGVDSSRFNNQNNKLYIYNTLGQLVKTVSVNNRSSISISTQNLSGGMYFVKANGSSTVLKFIKK